MSGRIRTYKRKQKQCPQTSSLSDAFTEHCFSDVTLVSDDQRPFQAHKYVLSAFSPVLKDILLNNPHPHPLIYLRGGVIKKRHTLRTFKKFSKL